MSRPNVHSYGLQDTANCLCTQRLLLLRYAPSFELVTFVPGDLADASPQVSVHGPRLHHVYRGGEASERSLYQLRTSLVHLPNHEGLQTKKKGVWGGRGRDHAHTPYSFIASECFKSVGTTNHTLTRIIPHFFNFVGRGKSCRDFLKSTKYPLDHSLIGRTSSRSGRGRRL